MRRRDDLATAAAGLRAVFDETFAAPAAEPGERPTHYLQIGVGSETFLVALAEVVAIQADRVIASLPSLADELLGIVTLHGDLVPVFGLAAMLGLEREAQPRWILISGGGEPIGFAFGRLDGQVGIAKADIAQAERQDRSERIAGTAALPGAARPILRLGQLREELAARIGASKRMGRG